jgi:hypothetical protein
LSKKFIPLNTLRTLYAKEIARTIQILKQHMGKQNVIKSRKIAEAIGIYEEPMAAHVLIRSLIRVAIDVGELPVGASGDGYYVICSQRELDEYVARLNGRARKMLGRASQVSRFFYNRSKQSALTAEELEA